MEPTRNTPQHNHSSSDQRYLDKLEFRPRLRATWLNFFVSNFRVVFLLILLISGIGLYAFSVLPRESNPEVKIPIAVVSTVFVGASPSDVEELVSKKIETKIASLRGLKTVTSRSFNSFSSIVVEFDAGEDLDDAIRRLRDSVLGTQLDLPEAAEDPRVTEISLDDQPIWTIALSGPVDGFELRAYADTIKDELEKIPGVREIALSGGDTREFEVAYDPTKLIFYGLTVDQANQAIRAQNVSFPSGNFEGRLFVYPISVDGRFFDVTRLSNTPLYVSGSDSMIYLKDVATIRETAVEKTMHSRMWTTNSPLQDAVTISVIKRTGGNVVKTVELAREKVDGLMDSFAPGTSYSVMTDMAKYIRDDFDQLTHDFLLTLLLVFGILFLIVGLKEALVAGLAIPLVFFFTFGVMLVSDISLNFLSIFSLILSLGLLVDDAIVVVSATKQYLNTGKFTPEEAVLLVLNDFKVVLTTTTLTTVWAFLPLVFASGIIGSFIRSIPITVSVTLLSSLAIALMINHPLAAVLERVRLTKKIFFSYVIILLGISAVLFFVADWVGVLFGSVLLIGAWGMMYWYSRRGHFVVDANQALVDREWQSDEAIKEKLRLQARKHDVGFWSKLIHGIIHFDRLIPIYEKYLRRALVTKKSRRFLFVGVSALFILSVFLPISGIVKMEFFPVGDVDTLYVDIQAPVGYTLSQTDRLARIVEDRLMSYDHISSFSTVIGRLGPLSNSFNSASDQASISVTLIDSHKRDPSYVLAQRLRNDLSAIDGATITISTDSGGPPTGSAFEARILGDDLATLERIARSFEQKLSAIPGIVNTSISLKDASPEYTFYLDPIALTHHSLTALSVGSALRTAIAGVDVTTVLRDSEEINVKARFDPASIPTLDHIQNIQIVNMRGQSVFLKDVARVELAPSVESILRVNQKRAVTITADVVAGVLRSNEALSIFQKNIFPSETIPQGYRIEYGGENEENTESVKSILLAMIIAIALIFTTLVIQFNSFIKAVIVLVTLPLALIGVFVGLAVFDIALSFPGLIGVLALFGIVVKNAIILIDKMNLNITAGIPFYESVIDAGKSRLEAIFITSLCTIFGLIPITLSNPMWTALGSAVIFGLSISSFFTLFVIPALFVSFVKPSHRDTRV